jgi:sodium-dependent phosphate cotransporter
MENVHQNTSYAGLKAVSVHIRLHWFRVALALLSMALFVLALKSMKAGAHPLQPILRDHLQVRAMWDGIGFGWVSATFTLAGSPIAAMAVALQDAGTISPLTAFGMINGSHLGGNFVVLLIGFLYVLRGADKRSGLSLGLIALLITETVHLPTVLIGSTLLKSGKLDGSHFDALQNYTSVIDRTFTPVVAAMARLVPDSIMLVIGLSLITVSFRLFDRVVPHSVPRNELTMKLKPLLRRPMTLFFLGMATTFVTLSMSISVGMLVPFTAHKLVQRKHLIPYIMGAGTTTFTDTFVASLLMRNPATVTVVAVQILSVALVSFTLILVCYRWYEPALLKATDFLLEHTWALGAYLAVFVAVPLLLLTV